MKPDCDLVRALAQGDLKEQQQGIIDGYLQTKQRGASRRQFRSVIEHLDFLAEILGGIRQPQETREREQLRALKAIMERPSAMGG